MIYKILLRNAISKRKPASQWCFSMSPFSNEPLYERGMLSEQSKLPKLPVPPLKESVEKYLKSVKPFLNEDEMKTTQKLAAELVAPGGVGELLHKLLQERAKTKENWLSDWWLQGAYLGYRNPVATENVPLVVTQSPYTSRHSMSIISYLREHANEFNDNLFQLILSQVILLQVYSSPAMAMPRQEFRTCKDQLSYAASLIQAVLDFKSKIDLETLSTEVQGKIPLDMMQFKSIFGTTREPHIPLDRLFQAKDSEHVVVAHQGNFYKVKVYENGELLKTEQILHQLHELVQDSETKGRGLQIGVLTSWHRDLWAQSFSNLSSDPKNRQALHALRDAIIVLCLDDPLSDKAPWQTISAHQLLVGGKNGENAGNRWCDKTIQFIVGAEGNVGLLYEHSPAEGPPVASLLDYCVKQASIWPVPPADDCAHKPEKLVFEANFQIEQDVEKATSDLKTLVDDLELSLYSYENYGKDFVKSCNLSPDSFIQMAIQLSFYRTHKLPGACYETATLRRFVGGRTETIRSCSEESLQFCQAFLDKQVNVHKKVEFLRTAVTAHKNYTNMAVSGQGIDRLFFGMKMMAAEVGLQIPNFFFDKGMVVSSHFRLSTSQVAAKSRSVMFYGPLVPDGYGCCYNPGNNFINFGLSAFKSCPTTNLNEFRNSLQQSLDELKDHLQLSRVKSNL